MPKTHVLAIDQGTTSTRAVVYNAEGKALGSHQQEIKQHYPKPGVVEHDIEDIWRSVATVVPGALAKANVDAKELAAIGITNQRETTIVWKTFDGSAIGRAIVWQDRRTADYCRQRKSDEPWLRERTGLVLDPYFSASKIVWILDFVPNLRDHAANGNLAFGTVDSFLLSRLTGGKVHATDVTNASRTMLLNLRTGQWDEELLRYFDIPLRLLPKVMPSCSDFGVTQGLDFLPDGVPITGIAGDQQAALFGQCCFSPGEAKCTYGTGAFLLQHLGTSCPLSQNRLLTTIAATTDQTLQYAMEGSVFVAGAAVQWLRDGLCFFKHAEEIEPLASDSDPDDPVFFVPAFVGLGAPHWVPDARGVIFGLSRSTTRNEICRAAMEGVAYQVADLCDAATRDAGQKIVALRMDGGMARNDWFMQLQADILGMSILQASQTEATAQGAAYLAGLRAGVWPNLDALRPLQGNGRQFDPVWKDEKRTKRLAQWRKAVRAVIAYSEGAEDVAGG